MGRELPQILNIIDLETTCYYQKGKDDVHDIIEISICTLDLTQSPPTIGDKRSILIKPKRSSISQFCTELTTITQEMVDEQGISLEEAFVILRQEYKCKNRAWCSWGDFDRNMFKNQCDTFRIDYPFGPRHINLKCLFSILNGLKWELGMKSALEKLRIPLTGHHHRGHDDAENIAKIASIMFCRENYAR